MSAPESPVDRAADRAPTVYVLISRAREGDSAAFTALMEQDQLIATRLARHYLGVPDVEEFVSEVFSRVWQHLLRGHGPSEAFRPYLLTSIRRMHHESGATSLEHLGPYDHGVPADEPHLGFSPDFIRRAYARLPDRWKVLLWHLEIEGASPDQVAQRYGLQVGAVSTLLPRAREGLRQGYLLEHLTLVPDTEAGDECRLQRPKLAQLVRGALSSADQDRLQEHLTACPGCANALRDLRTVNDHLADVLVASLLGLTVQAYQEMLVSGPDLPSVPAPNPLLASLPRSATVDTQPGVVSILDELPPEPDEEPSRPRWGLAIVAALAVLAVVWLGAFALTRIGGTPTTVAAPPSKAGYPTASLEDLASEPPSEEAETPRPTPTSPTPTPSKTPTPTATTPTSSPSPQPERTAPSQWSLSVTAGQVGAWTSGGSAKLRVSANVSGPPLPGATMVISGAAGFTGASADGWSCSSGSTVTCTRSQLPAGTSKYMVTFQAPQQAGTVTLTVRVSGQGVSAADSVTARIR